MDDQMLRIPDQPNQPSSQPSPQPDRPTGADSAADIARAKLRAIYNQQTQDARPPRPEPATQSNQLSPAQSHQPNVTPSDNATHPSTNNLSKPEQLSSQQHTHTLSPQQRTQYEASSLPTQIEQPHSFQQPQTFQPETPSASRVDARQPAEFQSEYQQNNNYRQTPSQNSPTTDPHNSATTPDIIQPTPIDQQPPSPDVLDFAIPGNQQQSPQDNFTANYIPAEQYSREVSLEDQIDGLRHAAPDHQLPVQTQRRTKSSWLPASLQPFLRTLALAAVIAIIYNHQFLVGQVQSYINPAQSVVSPTIVAPDQNQNIGDENKLLIPKINVDIPVVYDVTTFEESAVQAGLERGVVHYGNTALPGEKGNNVIVGHSSNNFWNNGEYKFAFVLLNKLRSGDTFTLHYEGKAYTYEVFNRRIVKPTEVDVIFEDFGEPVVTLITCDPPGTAWNRLVVNARQISPDPDKATQPVHEAQRPDEVITVPSDSSSLLENLFN